ncbi:hypothetical protein [Candidatus Hodgkinia cicadicola]|uniref:hypothetical protein n=1 Tax=Candidatus Hodgkinia cicadicola TaxID=573658 RepID=UPI0024151AB2
MVVRLSLIGVNQLAGMRAMSWMLARIGSLGLGDGRLAWKPMGWNRHVVSRPEVHRG